MQSLYIRTSEYSIAVHHAKLSQELRTRDRLVVQARIGQVGKDLAYCIRCEGANLVSLESYTWRFHSHFETTS